MSTRNSEECSAIHWMTDVLEPPMWTRSGHYHSPAESPTVTPYHSWNWRSKYLSVADFSGLISSPPFLLIRTLATLCPFCSHLELGLGTSVPLDQCFSMWGRDHPQGNFWSCGRKYFYCYDRGAGLFVCILQRTGQAQIAKNSTLSHVAGLDTSGRENL